MSKDFSKGAAWIRGDIVPIHEAKIGVTDWALTHSDVTYDVVPVWNRAFFRLGDYLDRFEASMTACHMDVGMDRAAIESALHDMVAGSGLDAAYVAMVAARGVPIIPGSRDPRDCANHFYAWCVPYVHVVKPEIAEAGVAVMLPDTVRRIPEDSVNPLVKNYHWGDFTQGLFAAKAAGFETVLLPDHAGNVTEGPGFNVFALKGNRVITPERGVLHGITRRTVLELAEAQGFSVEERTLPVAELMEADEVFLSSSGGGVIPVARINDRQFSNGAAGAQALRLRQAYWALMQDSRYLTKVKSAV
ncbi:branched-chain amino acid--2-keto-4-methylthiobutyrate aminotransferase [Roseovarius faecimaris]|uniref:Probable branched-chain-amino-acid aminotransferase n=1 Tax=Roseovarius faecimaris TaxID=2494550 RepID=A0A6I6IPU7_9RHOB|nr:aminotransferase class IV [Roseovarius faecimaris]QGX97851.1 branched-chain amino acid--2-keto-4-methylthiobutyrate aminotransferase [Roseovarius faecimaris]